MHYNGASSLLLTHHINFLPQYNVIPFTKYASNSLAKNYIFKYLEVLPVAKYNTENNSDSGFS